MDESKRYSIQYSEAAEEDIFTKAEYIEKVYRDSRLAYTWYTRLRNQIAKDLSFLPYKFQPYSAGARAEKGVREYIFRNDIVDQFLNWSTHMPYGMCGHDSNP